jgi:hypothetical protein
MRRPFEGGAEAAGAAGTADTGGALGCALVGEDLAAADEELMEDFRKGVLTQLDVALGNTGRYKSNLKLR